jgi:hypothetical protein
MSKHHVKSHHWYDGILKTVEHTFDSLSEAMHFAKNSNASQVKVYDHNQDLVHEEIPAPKNPEPVVNTYA